MDAVMTSTEANVQKGLIAASPPMRRMAMIGAQCSFTPVKCRRSSRQRVVRKISIRMVAIVLLMTMPAGAPAMPSRGHGPSPNTSTPAMLTCNTEPMTPIRAATPILPVARTMPANALDNHRLTQPRNSVSD